MLRFVFGFALGRESMCMNQCIKYAEHSRSISRHQFIPGIHLLTVFEKARARFESFEEPSPYFGRRDSLAWTHNGEAQCAEAAMHHSGSSQQRGENLGLKSLLDAPQHDPSDTVKTSGKILLILR